MSSKLDRFIQRSAQLGQEIESLQLKRGGPEQPAGNTGWQPRFEIYHHLDHLFIDVELPGVTSDSLQVEPREHLVVVRGEKPGLAHLPDREEIVSTREYGPFSCQFALPPGYTLDRLEQRLDNGVLHLKVRIIPRPALANAQ